MKSSASQAKEKRWEGREDAGQIPSERLGEGIEHGVLQPAGMTEAFGKCVIEAMSDLAGGYCPTYFAV